MNFRMCLSVIIVFVFSLTLHAVPGAKGTCNGSAGPQGRERYVSPDKSADYSIEITSDRDVYLVGMAALFTHTVSKWNNGNELPFNIQGKYLRACFPDRETEVELNDAGNNTWTCAAVLDSPGEKTMFAELWNANRRAFEHAIRRQQEKITELRAQAAEETDPKKIRNCEKQIRAHERVIERHRNNIKQMEPWAEAHRTIRVHAVPDISITAPAPSSHLKGSIPVIISSNSALPGTAELLIDDTAVQTKAVPPGDFSFTVDTSAYADGTYTLKARLKLPEFGFETESEAVEATFDNTPPSDVMDFTAESGNEQIVLTWTNPQEEDFAGVLVRRKVDSVPEDINDGTKVYEGPGELYTDTGLTNGIHYYYAAFTFDGLLNFSEGAVADAVPSGIVVPPDPEDVAPDIDKTVATTVYDATSFLYTGDNPIQTGVEPGTIHLERVCVIRGKVRDKQNNPISGVKITIKDHSEFGQTLTRTDGEFDIAVNGGSGLIVCYEGQHLIPVQRHIDVPWQDYVEVSDVVMIGRDSRVTPVDFTQPGSKVVRGSIETDTDGARQATILIPQGTTASIYNEDGTTMQADSLSMRFTEFSVGDNGQQTMPAELPPSSTYTYCVALEADEAAVKIEGKDVLFDNPVPFYVENFIGFPVGSAVPVGYYNETEGAWVPVPDGLVIGIVSETGGMADIDIDGDNIADDAAALALLNITDDERIRLGELYNTGDSLCRAQLTHFSWYDLNWPRVLSPWAVRPILMGNALFRKKVHNNPCEKDKSSVIQIQSQSLGESAGIAGTPFSVHYNSQRTEGYVSSRSIDIPLSDENLPSSCIKIHVKVHIAGRHFSYSFDPLPDQRYFFEWDGYDAYGRQLQGKQPVTIWLGYEYDVYYATGFNAEGGGSFGLPGGGSLEVIRAGVTEILWQKQEGRLGSWNSSGAQGMGGWTLSGHHTYDMCGRILYRGNGTHREAEVMEWTIDTVRQAATVHGGPVVAAPDGSIYYGNHNTLGSSYIYKIDPLGNETLVAYGSEGLSGDGGPATEAQYNYISDIALGPDGCIYIADTVNARIRKIDEQGIVTTVAGTVSGYGGDGGPAEDAQFDFVHGVAVGPDGSIYISDLGNHRIRRVGPDGIVETIAGTGVQGYAGNDGPAVDAQIGRIRDIVLGPDGSLYLADTFYHFIRRIDPEGIITTAAGIPYRYGGFSGDGGLAVNARFNWPKYVSVGKDETLYISDSRNKRIRRVSPDGIITTIAGGGTLEGSSENEGAPALQARLVYPSGIACAHDNSIVVKESNEDYTPPRRILRLVKSMPGLGTSDYFIASEDGSAVYVFDYTGRHLRTVDAVNGNTLLEFSYGADGLLTAITDIDGNITSIHRYGSTVEITAPFGQKTTLTIGQDGYLAGIANEAGETVQCSYYPDGLMHTFTNPRGYSSTFTYDPMGYLIKDEDAAGGYTELSRTETDTSFQVTTTAAGGQVSTYSTEYLPDGSAVMSVTGCGGICTVDTAITPDNEKTLTSAEGVTTVALPIRDPRFGMQSPLMGSMEVSMPSGLTLTMSEERSIELTDPTDLLSVKEMIDTVTINGRTYRTTLDGINRTIVNRSPSGIETTGILDSNGRIVETQVPGFENVNYAYDSSGRLTGIAQGTGTEKRETNVTYNTEGYIDTLTDPLSRSISFSYDNAGRITSQTLPDGRIISLTYDSNGNVTSITPPGKPAHYFTYTTVDLQDSYTAPDVGETSSLTQYVYDLDKRLVQTIRPDGQSISFGYCDYGKLHTITTPRGTNTLWYDAGTDATGLLTSIDTFDSQTLSYTYDGTLITDTQWTGTVNGTVSQTYTNDFTIDTQSVNSANTVSFGYNVDGALSSVGDLTIIRNPDNGVVTGTDIGNVSDSVALNTFGELSNYTAQYSGSDLLDISYTRDKLGRIETRTETAGGTTADYSYMYDLAGRLTEVRKDGTLISEYSYDNNGNRLSHTTPSGTVSGIYDDQDRLLTYGNYTYTYTANGELLTKTDTATGEVTSYDYDVLGNLRSVTLPDGTLIEYVIDGRNRRIGKKVNGTLVQGFLYQDDINPVAELDGSGNVVGRFVYGTKINVPDYMVKGGQTYRIISDHLGSPRAVINVDTGAVVQRMDFDEFGNVILDSNPGFQPFGFAGGIYDGDTGLTRFGARDYDAVIGRWTNRDPVKHYGGVNFYEYCESDPLNKYDPSGFWSFYRWLYTGDGNATDEIYEIALSGAEEAFPDAFTFGTSLAGYTSSETGAEGGVEAVYILGQGWVLYHHRGLGAGLKGGGWSIFEVGQIYNLKDPCDYTGSFIEANVSGAGLNGLGGTASFFFSPKDKPWGYKYGLFWGTPGLGGGILYEEYGIIADFTR